MAALVFWLVGMVFTVFASIVVNVTPALFHVCIFFEELIFSGVQRGARRLLSIGELTLASGVVWMLLALIPGLLFLAPYSGVPLALLICGSMGAVWGLSVGYQAAAREVVHQLRQPAALPHHVPGYTDPASGSNVPPDTDVSELWDQGIFLGQGREHRP